MNLFILQTKFLKYKYFVLQLHFFICNSILYFMLFWSFEEVQIDPGIYLNRGPKVELFTLDQRKPFTVCVVDIINHLAKLKLTIAIKLDVEIEEIEKALKASELKEKVGYKQVLFLILCNLMILIVI